MAFLTMCTFKTIVPAFKISITEVLVKRVTVTRVMHKSTVITWANCWRTLAWFLRHCLAALAHYHYVKVINGSSGGRLAWHANEAAIRHGKIYNPLV